MLDEKMLLSSYLLRGKADGGAVWGGRGLAGDIRGTKCWFSFALGLAGRG